MIVKHVTKPINFVQHEILLKRLKEGEEKQEKITRNFMKLQAGLKGEMSLEFFLSEWAKEDSRVFFDLRIGNFQIDIFLLCKNFGVILEVKNIYGKLFFDSKHQQLLRYSSKGEESFLYPLAQLNRQIRLLKEWLLSQNLSRLPIYGYVVIANSSTIIDSDKNIPQLIHAHSLLDRLETLPKIHKEEILQTRQFNRLIQKILNEHQLNYSSILERYQLNAINLLHGVECVQCSSFKMQRIHGTWQCEKCGAKDKYAHKQAIREYLLLNGKDSISNGEFRQWTGLKSVHAANKLLHRLGFLPQNEYKSRIYVAPKEFLYSVCKI